jgi:hypothetical protein
MKLPLNSPSRLPGPSRSQSEKVHGKSEERYTIESTGVPLAALWNFDLSSQESTLNVTADNPRSWVLDELQHGNERLQRKE